MANETALSYAKKCVINEYEANIVLEAFTNSEIVAIKQKISRGFSGYFRFCVMLPDTRRFRCPKEGRCSTDERSRSPNPQGVCRQRI